MKSKFPRLLYGYSFIFSKATHEVHRRDDRTVECAVQTRVHMKSMELMVSVQDIGEGSNVLVVWSDRHNAYMLFR